MNEFCYDKNDISYSCKDVLEYHTYKVAGVVFGVYHRFVYSIKLLSKFLYSGKVPELFKISTSFDEISALKDKLGEHPLAYYEGVAIHKRLIEKFLEYNIAMPLHCSAVCYNGRAYLFTANSGVGKSTHTSLWLEYFGNDAFIVNDDKPFVNVKNGVAYVYGSPWNGKNDLGCPCTVPIAGICHLKRGKDNAIQEIDKKIMSAILFEQTLRFEDSKFLESTLFLMEKIIGAVKTYELECNVSLEAVKVAYEGMKEE